MVSLYTLRDCLGLSFQGMYIYLVIIIIIIKWSTVQRSLYEYWIKILLLLLLLLLLLSLLFFIQFSLT